MMRRLTLALLLGALTLTTLACPKAINPSASSEVVPAGPAEKPRPNTAAPSDSILALFQQGVRTKTLDNGLVLITKENHAAPVVSAYVAVHAGGFFEGKYLGGGLSHLCEHLLAEEATTHRSELEVRKLYEQIGARSNAYTTEDHTVYFIDTTPEHVNTAIELLADAMMNSAVTPEEYKRELGVVQREILFGESQPGRQLFYTLDAAMFPHLPQGLRVIGYYENIQKLTRDDVFSYYKQWYVPSNMVMCVAGDFDGAKVLDQMVAAFKDWNGPHAPAVTLPEPAPLPEDLVAVKEMDTRQANVALAWRGVQITDPDTYALDVLADVLGGGESSRLATDLRLKRHLVYQISANNHTPPTPAGVFAVNWVCDPDKIDEVRLAVLEHLAALAQNAPTAAELDKVKKQTVARLVLGSRTASEQASSLATDQLQLADPFFTARYVDHLQNVQPADLARVAKKYLADAHYLTAIVRPKSAAVAVTPSPLGDGGPIGPGEGLRPKSAASTKATDNLKPSTTKIVLDNGLTLLVYRTPGQPAVSLTTVMKAGQTFETADNSGISAMTATYLTRGTTTRSEEQIDQFFDSIGGSIGAASGWNSIYLRSLVLKPDFPAALKVFADVLQHPAFKPDLLPAVQEDQKAALGAALTSAEGNCSIFFSEQFFPYYYGDRCPYRFPSTGSAAAIKNLAADAVRDFYKRFAVAKNIVLVVAGDVDPPQVEALVKTEFAALPPGEKAEPPVLPAFKAKQTEEIYLQKVDKKGAVIIAGYPGVDLFNLRDRLPMDIFSLLISHPSKPRSLHNVLRGQSLVYGAFFNGRPGLLPGFFRSESLDCKPENATLVARLMIDMIQAAHDMTFTDDDLRDARSLLLTGRKLARQTPEEVAFEMSLNELYGFGYDFEDKYPELLAAVTADDIKRVIKTYLNNPMICISTPAPDKVDQAELRRPYDAAKLKEMMDKLPTDITPERPRETMPK